MNLQDVRNPEIRAILKNIQGLSDEQIRDLGLTPRLRDNFLRDVVVPTEADDKCLDVCWGWTGSVMHPPKSRCILYNRGVNVYAYRAFYELHHGRRIESGKLIRHVCPDGENPLCCNPRHLREGTHRDNTGDMIRYGTFAIAGGSTRHVEALRRGLKHPKSRFESMRPIQAMRAKWDSVPEKEGLVAAFARHYHLRTDVVSAIVKRERYTDVPDDPEAAADLAHVTVNKPGSKRGAANNRAKMSDTALELFNVLFQHCKDRGERKVLKAFIGTKYGMADVTLEDIGRGRTRRQLPQVTPEMLDGVRNVNITPESLAVLFRSHAPLRGSEASSVCSQEGSDQ